MLTNLQPQYNQILFCLSNHYSTLNDVDNFLNPNQYAFNI